MSFSNASLIKAVAEGDRELLASLLATGADVNSRNDGGQTPLILAIIFGQDQILPILLKQGADPFLKDQTGLDALDWAERKGRMDLVRVLQGDVQPKLPNAPETPRRTNVSSEQRSTEQKSNKADEEKTRRYLAGLRRRFAENPHPKALETPQPRIATPKFNNTTGPDNQSAPVIPQANEPKRPRYETPSRARSDQPQRTEQTSAPIHTEANTADQPFEAAAQSTSEISPTIPRSSSRKRCPQCNTIYNSDLLSYCAYHVVPLVDADEPIVVAPDSNRFPILLWTLVLFTLCAAAIATAYVSGRLFRNEAKPNETAASQPAHSLKGIPVAKGQLGQKVVSLPTAEAPLNATQQTATVEVSIRVNRLGKVIDVSSSSENQLLRESALAAAKKATFSVEKLRNRGTTGVITYTFNR